MVQDSSTPGTPQSITQSGLTFTVMSFTPTSLPAGTASTAYPTQTFTATNALGAPSFTWMQTGTLPPGLTFTPSSTTATLSGTPTTAGTYNNITVSVTDTSSGQVATQTFSITVSPAMIITTTTLQDGTVGVPYSVPVNVTGGTGPYTWSISGGALPSCLSLSPSTGFITGTPIVACEGAFSFIVKVTDSTLPTANTATHTLSVNINAASSAVCESGNESAPQRAIRHHAGWFQRRRFHRCCCLDKRQWFRGDHGRRSRHERCAGSS